MSLYKFRSLSLFATVCQHEWRLLWRSRTALLLFVCVFCLVGVAVKTGQRQLERQTAVVDRLHTQDKTNNDKHATAFVQDPQSYRQKPYVATLLLRQHASLSPGALAALDTGQSDLRPFAYPLHTDWQKVFLVSGPLRGEASLKTGHFDVSFLVVYLLPLVVIALCFNLLAGERERGILVMLLSQPISPNVLLFAALLVRFLLVEIVVIGAVTFWTYAGFGAGVSLETIPHFLLWSALISLYVAFWFALCAFVVALGGKSSGNALILIMSWALFTIVLPAGVALAAINRHPVPPRSEIMRAVNVTRDEAFENWRDNEKSFRLFYKDFPELIPVGAKVAPEKIIDPLTEDSDFQSRVMIVIPYAVEQVGLKMAQPHREALRNQQQFVGRMQWFSPTIIVREGLMEVAGTGDSRYNAFEKQATTFWTKWRYDWVKRMFRGPLLTADDYRNGGQFRFQEEKIGGIANRLLPGMGVIAALTILQLFFASRYLRKHSSPLTNG